MGRAHAYILIVVFFIAITSSGQVLNVDREFTEDSLRKKYDVTANLFLSSDKQKNNLLDISTNIEYDKYLKNKYILLALFRNDATFNGAEMLQNEGLAHIRYRDNDHRKFSPEFYGQYQWNGAWGMEYRYLMGSNFRIKIMDKQAGDIYGAIGAFYEVERWNWNGVKSDLVPNKPSDIQRDMLRLNTYIKASRKLTRNIDVSSISYLQFPLKGIFFQPRWYFEANMYVAATDKIELVLHWDHIKDVNRVVPIDDFFYTFSMGIQVNL
jgi:hypothetical protein